MNLNKTAAAVAIASALYANFATDPELEKNGIDLQYGVVQREIDGKMETVPVIITIARAGGANQRFDKVFEHKTKPYKRMIQTDSLDPEIGKQIMRETFAETVILGWQNVQNQAGEFLEFNRANVLAVLKDLPDLFVDIQQQANKAALFRAVVVEEDVKN